MFDGGAGGRPAGSRGGGGEGDGGCFSDDELDVAVGEAAVMLCWQATLIAALV